MTKKFLLNSQKDWLRYSKDIYQIPNDKKAWWDLSKINNTQKQCMLGYVDHGNNNFIGSSKLHYVSQNDLQNRGLYHVFHPNEKIMEVVDMYVNPNYRGGGYCKQLIKDSINVSNHKKRSLFLVVEGDNAPAQRCCESNGFQYIEPTEQLIEFYRERWDFLKDPMFMVRKKD